MTDLRDEIDVSLAEQAAAEEAARQPSARSAVLRYIAGRLFAVLFGTAINFIQAWVLINLIAGAGASFRVLIAVAITLTLYSLQLATLRR